MSVPTIGELLQDKTKEVFFEELVAAAQDEGLSTSAWQPGEPIRAVMSMVARVLAVLWTLLARPSLRAGFLDFAEGGWLTLLAWTCYGVKRRGKDFATRGVTCENRSGNFYTVVPGQIRIKNGVTGKTFRNTTGGALLAWGGSGAYPSNSFTFVADEAGTASDTIAGDLVELPTSGPTGVYAQVSGVFFLGSDEELDPALRDRCRLAMAVLSPAGPKAAYLFTALSTFTPDGAPVAVNRVRVVDFGNSSVAVHLANASGPTPGTMGTPGSDVALVYEALEKSVIPVGFSCVVLGAEEVTDSVTVTLIVSKESGLTAIEAVTAATAAITAYVSKVPIGGYRSVPPVTATTGGFLFLKELQAKASESADGIVTATAVLTSGAADLAIPYNKIPKFTDVNVTATVVRQQ